MKTTQTWFEFPYGKLEFFIRFIVAFIILLAGSYWINGKFYIIPNILVCISLLSLFTDQNDSFAENLLSTVVYSTLIGLIVYGYHFFRLYTPRCIEVYKFTGQGILLTMIAGIVSYLSTYHYKIWI
jgi:hypothetical protein